MITDMEGRRLRRFVPLLLCANSLSPATPWTSTKLPSCTIYTGQAYGPLRYACEGKCTRKHPGTTIISNPTFLFFFQDDILYLYKAMATLITSKYANPLQSLESNNQGGQEVLPSSQPATAGQPATVSSKAQWIAGRAF